MTEKPGISMPDELYHRLTLPLADDEPLAPRVRGLVNDGLVVERELLDAQYLSLLEDDARRHEWLREAVREKIDRETDG